MSQEIILYPHQARDIELIEEKWEDDVPSILYQLPTGGGKSVIIAKLILDKKDSKIVVFAHKKELVFQLYNRLKDLGINVGVIIGSTEIDIDADVLVCSIRTVMGDVRIWTILDRDWDYAFIDEARHCVSASYTKVLDQLILHNPMIRMLGVDATPYRRDKKRLDEYFNDIIVSDSVAELIKNGFLCNYRVFHTPIENISSEVAEYANDYNITQLSKFMRKPQYINYLIKAYLDLGEMRQAIVYAVDKAHGKDITANCLKHLRGLE